MTFPAAVPELPVTSIDTAANYYVAVLGFTLDWGGDGGGIAGISRGQCRLFLTDPSFREHYRTAGPVLFWLNLDGKTAVDELHAQWKAAGAKIVSDPDDTPWKLHEFTASDRDGNLIRVFYDFRRDQQ
ncbi:MAG: VOC family protein [Acidobacteriota bacterium]|nr:VOC family protein [Acidobacteriota bacterium]